MINLLIHPALRVWHELCRDRVAAVQEVGCSHAGVAHEVHQGQAEGCVRRPLVVELPTHTLVGDTQTQ